MWAFPCRFCLLPGTGKDPEYRPASSRVYSSVPITCPRRLSMSWHRSWGCPVFEHYGMTEMGLGGGVQCSAHKGYHLREADLLFEIIDPRTGQPVPDGETGEVVFTTLTRKAMPLIRYRTGDLARFIPGPCPCGTLLKRLDRIQGRLTGAVVLDKGHQLSIPDLDDVVFSVRGILDYQAEVYGKEGRAHLRLKVHVEADASKEVGDAVSEALGRDPLSKESRG